MSSVVKSVYKKVSSVVHHIDPLINMVHKAFKKVWGTTIGRIAISAIAVYFGGWALGAWAGPSALLGGGTEVASTAAGTIGGPAANAVAAGEAAGTTAGTVGGAAAAGDAGAIAAQAGSTDFLAGAAGGAATGGGAQAGGGLIASQMAAPAAGGAVADAGSTGFLASALPGGVAAPAAAETPGLMSAAGIVNQIKNLGGFLGRHELLTSVGVSALAGALTPSAAQDAEEAEKANTRRLNNNAQVGSLNVGTPTGNPLTDNAGNPIFGPDGRPQRTNLNRNMGVLEPPKTARPGIVNRQMGAA